MSHLDYYIEHGISPVRYDLSNVRDHLQRRESLYRTLGLLPLTFRDADVLEVAAGSGQNSFFIATQRPKSLTLLEPNPTGVKDIYGFYAGQRSPHTSPAVIQKKLEDYVPANEWDIVICENWLGASAHDRALFQKLLGFLREGGVLVLTALSPIGFVPNLIRRTLAAKLLRPRMSFQARTDLLVGAFSSHLKTLGSMTRNPVDWVHDNLMNPAYFDLCLTIPMIVSDLGEEFQTIGTNPVFSQDWRWFKSLYGTSRRFNDHLLEQYWLEAHNFIDYRIEMPRCLAAQNKALEAMASRLIDAVRDYERAIVEELENNNEPTAVLERCLADIMEAIREMPSSITEALQEAVELLLRPHIDPHDVASSQHFKHLFGRETLYISVQREMRHRTSQ